MAKSKAEVAVVNGHFAHATTFTGKKRIRHSFGRIPEAVQTAEPDRGAARLL